MNSKIKKTILYYQRFVNPPALMEDTVAKMDIVSVPSTTRGNTARMVSSLRIKFMLFTLDLLTF